MRSVHTLWGYPVPVPVRTEGTGGTIGPMATTQIRPRIPGEVAKLAKIKAENDGLTLGEYIAELIINDTTDLKAALDAIENRTEVSA